MNKTLNGMAILIIIILVSLIQVGCTPGKTQLKRNINGTPQKEYTRVDELGFDEENSSFDEDSPRVREKNEAVKKYDDQEVSDESLRNGQTGDEFFQKGMASWYGREFHGKITASGERFNMNEYTAAHRTLPFGSIVEVKNLENGKTVKVKINDRGPYKGNRVIDLSFNAARNLDIVRQGQTMVGITVLKRGEERGADNAYLPQTRENSRVEPVVEDYYDNNDRQAKDSYTESGDGNYSIQAGAFYSRRNADKLKEKIESLTNMQVIVSSDGDMYKVRIKGINNKREADKLKKILANENIPSFIIE